jgi:hypothetical protein
MCRKTKAEYFFHFRQFPNSEFFFLAEHVLYGLDVAEKTSRGCAEQTLSESHAIREK